MRGVFYMTKRNPTTNQNNRKNEVKIMKNTNIRTIVAGANGNVDELKGLLSAARANGEKKVIVRIPRRLMAIDTRYQMENRTERDLKYLVNNWDERKLLPVTGITLPIISYGGTSLMMSLIMIGLVLNVSRYRGE